MGDSTATKPARRVLFQSVASGTSKRASLGAILRSRCVESGRVVVVKLGKIEGARLRDEVDATFSRCASELSACR